MASIFNATYKRFNGLDWDTFYFETTVEQVNGLQTILDGLADITNSVYYVEGNTTGTEGVWTGSITGLTEYYDGLKIAYRVGILPAESTTLNINNLGAITLLGNSGNNEVNAALNNVLYFTYITISGTGYFIWYDATGSGGSNVTISSTPPEDPNPGDLWWDDTDATLYIFYDDGTSTQWVVTVPGGGGGGAVDSVNGLTGEVVLGAADVGAVDLTGDTMTGNLELPSLSIDGQSITWNSVDGTFDFELLDGVTLQAGQEVHFYGKAQSAVTNGQAVMFTGVQGDHILFAPATATALQLQPELFIGVATHDIGLGEFGYITWFGYVRDISTDGLSLGDILYVNTNTGATDGTFTTTKPSQAIIQAAVVVKLETGSANNGILLVRPKFVSRSISDITGLQTELDTIDNHIDDTTIHFTQSEISITESQISDFGDYEPANANIQTHISSTNNPHSVTAAQVGLGNVTNESKATMFTNPTFTGTVSGVTKTHVGLGNVTNDAQIPLSQKGTANGVAELDANGIILSSQLPSFVDDVLEYANLAGFPTTGETGKIYIAQDTNKTYRWSGSAYTEISASLALGETSSTAYRGDRGKIAYDHTSLTNNPHSVTAAQVGAEPAFTKNTAFNKNFGTAAGTVTEGNDSRLSDARTPLSHTHLKEDITDFSHSHGNIDKNGSVFSNIGIETGDRLLITDSNNLDAVIATSITFDTSNTTEYLRRDGTFATPDTGAADNNYLTGVSGSGNSTVTFTRQGLTNLTWNAAHTHSAADITSGTLGVARGGTGATTFTSGNVLIGAGTGAVTTLSRSGIDTRSTFPPATHTHTEYVSKSGDTMTGDLNIIGANKSFIIGEDANNVVQLQWNDSGNFGKLLTREAGTYYDNTLVLKTGNVGIGTTSPGAKLDVTGEVKAESFNIDGAATMSYDSTSKSIKFTFS